MSRRGLAIAVGGTGLVVIAVLLYLQPILTARAVAHAMVEGDAEALRDLIDFQAVRESLKEQLHTHVIEGAWEGPGAPGGSVVNAAIDQVLRAEFNAKAMAGTGREGRPVLLSTDYETPSQFHAVFASESDGASAVTLVFRRDRLRWRVTAMKLDDGPLGGLFTD